jgi:hypothetical protein
VAWTTEGSPGGLMSAPSASGVAACSSIAGWSPRG